MFCHLERLTYIPVAEHLTTSDNSQTLVAAQLWSTHLQTYRLYVGFERTLNRSVTGYALREGTTVEIAVLGSVYPLVVNHVACAFLADHFKTVSGYLPLYALCRAVTFNTIVIVNLRTYCVTPIEFVCPLLTINGIHVV